MKSFNDWKKENYIDESLSIAQRRKRALLIKRIQPKIRRGRALAKRRMAPPEKLRKRARKQARTLMFKKFSKGVSSSNLSIGMRRAIEDRLKSKSGIIDKIAKKLYPKVKKAEVNRLRSAAKGEVNTKGVSKIKSATPGQ